MATFDTMSDETPQRASQVLKRYLKTILFTGSKPPRSEMMMINRNWFAFACLLICGPANLPSQELEKLEIQVSDATNQSVACRIHLQDEEGNAFQPPGLPFWRDHFVCDGRATLELAAGTYTYMIERGPEYRRINGKIDVLIDKPAKISARLERMTSLRGAGWFSGDLHIHRPIEQVELLMDAEDLDFGPVITWWNTQNRWARNEIPADTIRRFSDFRYMNMMAGEDERGGGALLFFGLKRPLDISGAEREFPSPMSFVQQAAELNPAVWIDIEKPFWWDVPVWVASGQMKSIGIANNHMCHSSMYENEAWGKPRDTARLPNPRGNGYWTQEIFYHILNTGIRIAPSAGSASGVLPNPVGYNRVYVHLNERFQPTTWWNGLSKSNCFVTNGPLLLVTANQKVPGSVLTTPEIELKIEAISQDALASIEIIKNGQIVKTIAPNGDETQRFAATLRMNESSWFLVRAITGKEETFRFASTAPFFVELPDQSTRISLGSCKFFTDWVTERIKQIEKNVRDPNKRKAVLAYQQQALKFWQEKMQAANAP